MGMKAVPFIYEIIKQMPHFIVFALENIFGFSIDVEQQYSLDELCSRWVSYMMSKSIKSTK